MKKLWVDDSRPAPDDSCIVARNYDEAIKVLQLGFVKVISLDHDLGENSKTGYDIVKWMESTLRCGNIANINCEFRIHSSNPVGRANMIRGINAIQDYLGHYINISN